MKNKIIILSFLLIIAALNSCKKFLEEKSQDQLIPTTTTDFLQLLYGQAYPSYDGNSPLQRGLVFMDDDVQINNIYKGTLTNDPGSRPGSLNSINALLPVYSWQPDAYEQISQTGLAGNKDHFNSWARYYALIMGANLALDNADKSQGTDDDKAYLKGQAYGLRAYYYFMLVNMYGLPYNYNVGKDPAINPGVPLILTAVVEEATLYQKRNTVKEVYDQIISDINASITNLEKAKKFNGYRMNYLAVHLLASRVYLYMEDWNKAIEQANIVIAEKPALMNLTSALVQSNSNPVNLILGSNNLETLWTFGSLTDYQELYGTSKNFRLSDDLVKCFTNNDLRTKGTFMLTNVSVTQYAYSCQTNKQYMNNGITMKAFRVAEAYLNRAEAYVQLGIKNNDAGMVGNGLTDLNTLRSSRYSNPANWSISSMPSFESALDSCRLERRKELFLEDHRWFDLRRYGMPSITHVYYNSATDSVKYTLNAGDKGYVWAIPQEVLDRNNLLQQNELDGRRASSAY